MKNITPKTIEDLFEEIKRMTPAKRTQFIQRMEELATTLTLGNGDTIDGFIFKTRDTQQFGNVKGNRIINEESAYIRELAQSISEIGNVAPVIINEKGETIDGQRRIMAVRKYGLNNPIRYTRVIGADIGTVGDLNRLQQTWTYKDWLNKYVEIGNVHYKEYQALEEKYGKYVRPRSLRSLAMNNRIEAFKADTWEHGGFYMNKENEPQLIKFLDLLVKIHDIGAEDNIFAKNRNFQRALHEIFKATPNLDEERLLKKIRMNFPRLNVRTETDEYRKILLDIYNTRQKKEAKIQLPEETPGENGEDSLELKAQAAVDGVKRGRGRPKKVEIAA